MEFLNSEADNQRYQSALQAVNQSRALRSEQGQESAMKANEANEQLRQLLDPIGSELIKKPAEELIRRAASTAQSQIAKGIQRLPSMLQSKAPSPQGDSLSTEPGSSQSGIAETSFDADTLDGASNLPEGAGEILPGASVNAPKTLTDDDIAELTGSKPKLPSTLTEIGDVDAELLPETGEIPVVGEVVAGIAGIASLLGAAFGGKKAETPTAPIVNMGAQSGI